MFASNCTQARQPRKRFRHLERRRVPVLSRPSCALFRAAPHCPPAVAQREDPLAAHIARKRSVIAAADSSDTADVLTAAAECGIAAEVPSCLISDANCVNKRT
jgi:hypothetical protein